MRHMPVFAIRMFIRGISLGALASSFLVNRPQLRRPEISRSAMFAECFGDLASFQKCARSLWRLPAEILKSCLAGTEGLVPFTP
jgi:hypothetical protein